MQQLLLDHGARVNGALRKEFRSAVDSHAIEETLNLATHQVWRSIHTYREDKGELRAWFYVIARNAALKIMKREEKQRPALITNWEYYSLAQQRAAEASTRSNDRYLAALRACISALPPLQKHIIQADLESGDVADARSLAETLGTSKNSIYVSRSLARKTLKRGLTRLGLFSEDDPGPQRTMEQSE